MIPVPAPNKTIERSWVSANKLKGLPGILRLLDQSMPPVKILARMITITLHPFFHDKKDSCVIKYSYHTLQRYCRKNKIDLWLQPEYTLAGNLHWHGTASFPDYVTMCKFNKFVRTRFGTQMQNELIKRTAECRTYILKHANEMHALHRMYYTWFVNPETAQATPEVDNPSSLLSGGDPSIPPLALCKADAVGEARPRSRRDLSDKPSKEIPPFDYNQ